MDLLERTWASTLALTTYLMLTGCGGGDDAPADVTPPVGGPPIADACHAVGDCEDLRIDTPFTEDGDPVQLRLIHYQPRSDGPHPTLIFHHGSTGNGSDPSLFPQVFNDRGIARFFVNRGWAVVFPQRRGRGGSDGLYDEGFAADRSGYSCEATRSLAGAERAMDDADVVLDHLQLHADVDVTRMLVGGVSRGGALSIAHVERRPDAYLGVVNFVGGWIGEGCGDHLEINRRLFEAGAPWSVPSIWLYGLNDSFYPIGYSRGNFDAYTLAGGMGSFHEYDRGGTLNGHFLLGDEVLWDQDLDAFLAGL